MTDKPKTDHLWHCPACKADVSGQFFRLLMLLCRPRPDTPDVLQTKLQAPLRPKKGHLRHTDHSDDGL